MKDELILNYKVPPEDIYVVYNGVDLDKFHPRNKGLFYKEIRDKYNISLNEFLILFVGSGFRRKGLIYLLKAVGILKDKPLKLLVVGRGRIGPYVRIIKKLNIENKVIFTGSIKNEINKIYTASDIFILPSIYESFGNVCLEAMASGIPVIVSRNCGASEIITHKENGLIINNPKNSYEVSEAIKFLLSHKDIREKISIEARKTAENYTIEKNISEIIEIFNKVKNRSN